MTALVQYGGKLLGHGGKLLNECCAACRWRVPLYYLCGDGTVEGGGWYCDDGLLVDNGHWVLGTPEAVADTGQAAGWDGANPGYFYGPVHTDKGCPCPETSDVVVSGLPDYFNGPCGTTRDAYCAMAAFCPHPCASRASLACSYEIVISGLEDATHGSPPVTDIPWSKLNGTYLAVYDPSGECQWLFDNEIAPGECGHDPSQYAPPGATFTRIILTRALACGGGEISGYYKITAIMAYEQPTGNCGNMTLYFVTDPGEAFPVGTLSDAMCNGPSGSAWIYCSMTNSNPGDPTPPYQPGCSQPSPSSSPPAGSPACVVTDPNAPAMLARPRIQKVVESNPQERIEEAHRTAKRTKICEGCEHAKLPGWTCSLWKSCCFGRARMRRDTKCPAGKW